jgi:hypothetical protein
VLHESIAHLFKRPDGWPLKDVRRYFASFSYQAGTWDKPRRVVAKVEWHPGEFCPRVGFIVTKLVHVLTDLLGRPAVIRLTAGNVSDVRAVDELLAAAGPIHPL